MSSINLSQRLGFMFGLWMIVSHILSIRNEEEVRWLVDGSPGDVSEEPVT